MKKRDMGQLLVSAFDSKWKEFEGKVTRLLGEVSTDLKLLQDVHGAPIIEGMINESALPIREVLRFAKSPAQIKLAATAPHSNSTAVDPNPSVPQEPKVKIKRRRRNVLSFSALQPFVLEVIVNELKGKRFSIREVKSALNSRKIKYDQTHLSLILLQYIKGLTVVSRGAAGSKSLKWYEATSEVTLTKPVRASQRHLPPS